MVGHFIRLKTRTLRNRLRRDSAFGVAIFILIWAAAVVVGSVAGIGIGAAGRAAGPAVAQVAYGVFFVGWIVIPLIAASVEETIVPAHFELLPVPPTRLAGGLLASAFVSPGAVGTALALIVGTLLGYATGPLSAVVALGAGALATVLAVSAARLATTWMSSLAAGSPVRQVVGLAIMLVLVLPGLVGSVVASVAADGETVRLPSGVAWLNILAPVGLGRAVDGPALESAAYLAYGVVWLGAILWAWGRVLVRQQTDPQSSRRRQRPGALVPRFLPDTPVGAVAAKELVYLRRDPRIRMQLIGAGVAAVAVTVGMGAGSFGTPYLPFTAVFVGFVMGTGFAFNLFGVDGGTFWAYAAGPARAREVLVGKNLAWTGLAVGASTVAAAVGSIAAGSARFLVPATVAAAAMAMLWSGVGNVASVWGGYPLPEDNVFANRNVSGRTAAYSLAALLAAAFISAPVVVGYVVGIWRWGTAGSYVASVIAAAYAAWIYRLGVRLGSEQLAERLPRLVETFDGA